MNIVIVGKSGSGKNEVCKYLTEYLRYDRIISCTTRKPRHNESNLVDYYFLTNEEYDKENLILKTEIFGNKYGFKKEELENCNNCVFILDPNGLEEIKDVVKNYVSFYVTCNEKIRYNRCISRGDSMMQTLTRIYEEEKLFENINTDYIVDNSSEDVWDCVISILEHIKECENRG